MGRVAKFYDSSNVKSYVDSKYFEKKPWEPKVISNQYPYGDFRRYGITTAGNVTDVSMAELVIDACKDRCVVNIPEGTYKLNRKSILQIAYGCITGTVETSGQGSVVWDKWKDGSGNICKNNAELLNYGIIPAEKLRDPLFLSMKLPSESNHYMNRVNGSFHYKDSFDEDYANAVAIGAIYRNAEEDAEIPDNFTLCLGRIKLYVMNNDSEYWVLADNSKYPATPSLYKEGWDGSTKSVNDKIQYFDDHIEIALTKEDFEGYILHFWGNTRCEGVQTSNHRYVISAFDCWIKEPEYEKLFVSAIGVDFRNAEGTIRQAYSGRSQYVMSYPRTLWGHTIPDADYDEVIDIDYIQDLFNDAGVGEVLNISSSDYSAVNFNNFTDNFNLSANDLLMYKSPRTGRMYPLNREYELCIPTMTSYGKDDRCLIATWGNNDADKYANELRAGFKIRIMHGTNSSLKYGEFVMYLGCKRTLSKDETTWTYSSPFARIIPISWEFEDNGRDLFTVTFSETNGIKVYLKGAFYGHYMWKINVAPMYTNDFRYWRLFKTEYVKPYPSKFYATDVGKTEADYWITTPYDEDEVHILDFGKQTVMSLVDKEKLDAKIDEIFKI